MTTQSHLEAILHEIQGKTANDLQSPVQAQEYLIQLTGWLSYSGEQQAVSSLMLNKAKKSAYFNLEANFRATGHELKPMLAKDFVHSQCHDEAFLYELAERCNRTVTHTLDAVRSILSSLKAEVQTARHY